MIPKGLLYRLGLAVSLVALAPSVAFSSGALTPKGGDDFATVLIALTVVIMGAKLGAFLAQRVSQPPVLGELIFGVLLGNLTLVGLNWIEPLTHLNTIHTLAEIGVILLLFEVGLESDLGQMMKVGMSSFLVAMLGVVGPFLLGWGVGVWFYPGQSIYMHVFLGAVLTATSVGITARVLKDIKKIDSDEARIILGAAIIDDVLGLLILAVVSGIIYAADTGTEMSSLAILWLIAKAMMFLFGAIVVGRLFYKQMFRVANYMRVHGMLLITALASCFLMAFLAAKVGLAPIVGAFAAGLVLDDVYYSTQVNLGKHSIEEVLAPVAMFLVPIFFVTVGMDVDLSMFTDLRVIGFSLMLTLAAVVGKQFSSIGVVQKKGARKVNRWIVGLGMIPRGEVGLIFAGIGLTLFYKGKAIETPEIYSAVVLMVMLTTVISPPLLTWAFRASEKKS